MLEDTLEKAQAYGADQCEVFLQEATTAGVKFEDSRLKSVESSQTHGIAVRVLVNERLGFGAGSDFGRIRPLLQAVVDSAWQSDKIGLSFPSTLPAEDGAKLEDEGVRRLQLDEMARSAERAIMQISDYDSAILTFGGIGKADLHIRIANSVGFDSAYRKTLVAATVGGQLVEGQNILFCYRDAAGTNAALDFDNLTQRVIEDFEASRTNVEIEGGPKTVIFTPRAAIALFDVLKLGVNGRNVEKGTSPIRDKMGKKVLSERITLIEDGLLEGAIGSAPFDDEGTVLEKKAVVDQGVLKSFAVDLRTAQKLDLPPSGNGFRMDRYTGTQSYESPPSPQSTNWLLLPGEKTCEEMLAEIKDGVIVDLMMGLFTGNLLSGDFSANLSLAHKISNGKIVGRIKNAMVSGNFYDIFRDNLVAISRETERVTHGFTTNIFPYLCAKDVMIST